MSITASLVQELRQKTGVGMMKCKEALTETNGDLEAAILLLREKGLATASKKSDREVKDGRVFTAVSDANAIILELSCETDFVANNEVFIALGNQLATHALQENMSTKEDLESSTIDGDPFQELLSNVVLKIGENIVLGKVERVTSEGAVSDYIHSNGKIGVLVSFTGAVDTDLGRDIAMQVAAASPQYVSANDVDASQLESERGIFRKQCEDEGKPEQMIDKIVDGKIKKYCKEICLLDQAFIKDSSQSVQDTLPEGITVQEFKRYTLG